MATILADGWLVTMNPHREVLERASLMIEGDHIAALAPVSSATIDQPSKAAAPATTREGTRMAYRG